MSRAASPKQNSAKSFREWLSEHGVEKISGAGEGGDKTVMKRLATENKLKFNFRDKEGYQKFIGLFDRGKFANIKHKPEHVDQAGISLAELEQLLFSYNQYVEGFNKSSPLNRGRNSFSGRSSQSNATNSSLVSPKQSQSFPPSSEVKKESHSNASVLSPEQPRKAGYDSSGKPLSVDVSLDEQSDDELSSEEDDNANQISFSTLEEIEQEVDKYSDEEIYERLLAIKSFIDEQLPLGSKETISVFHAPCFSMDSQKAVYKSSPHQIINLGSYKLKAQKELTLHNSTKAFVLFYGAALFNQETQASITFKSGIIDLQRDVLINFVKNSQNPEVFDIEAYVGGLLVENKEQRELILKSALKIIFRLSFLEEQEASLNNSSEDSEESPQEEGRLKLLQEQLEQERLQNETLRSELEAQQKLQRSLEEQLATALTSEESLRARLEKLEESKKLSSNQDLIRQKLLVAEMERKMEEQSEALALHKKESEDLKIKLEQSQKGASEPVQEGEHTKLHKKEMELKREKESKIIGKKVGIVAKFFLEKDEGVPAQKINEDSPEITTLFWSEKIKVLNSERYRVDFVSVEGRKIKTEINSIEGLMKELKTADNLTKPSPVFGISSAAAVVDSSDKTLSLS